MDNEDIRRHYEALDAARAEAIRLRENLESAALGYARAVQAVEEVKEELNKVLRGAYR